MQLHVISLKIDVLYVIFTSIQACQTLAYERYIVICINFCIRLTFHCHFEKRLPHITTHLFSCSPDCKGVKIVC